jgi:hypothetical protein
VHVLALLLLLPVLQTPTAAPSASANQPTLAQVAKASRTYFRDSAELPLVMAIELTAKDPSGRIRKHKTGKVKYDFHGYNPRSENMNANLRGSGSVIKAAFVAAISSTLPMALLTPKADQLFNLSFQESSPPEIVSMQFVPTGSCEPMKWSADAYGPESLCGSYVVQLTRDGLVLRHFSFAAAGLPITGNVEILGMTTISGYHVDAEFQDVMLPDDPKPFRVPKWIAVTVETAKGTLHMKADYSLKK